MHVLNVHSCDVVKGHVLPGTIIEWHTEVLQLQAETREPRPDYTLHTDRALPSASDSQARRKRGLTVEQNM